MSGTTISSEGLDPRRRGRKLAGKRDVGKLSQLERPLALTGAASQHPVAFWSAFLDFEATNLENDLMTNGFGRRHAVSGNELHVCTAHCGAGLAPELGISYHVTVTHRNSRNSNVCVGGGGSGACRNDRY